MIYFFSFILMAGALGYLALPLFRGAREEPDPGPDESSELETQKTAAYTAIKELQFDYELGNLTPDDHQELETKYRKKAARILKDLDEMKTRPQFDDLETEIMNRRRGGRSGAVSARGDAVDDIEREIARRRAGATAGRRSSRGLPVSAREGDSDSLEREIALKRASIQAGSGAAARACPRCGKPQRPEIKFCTHCGTDMARMNLLCPSCGKPFLPEDRFCPQCGASLKKEDKQ